MDTTSPSKKAARVDNQENRMVRERIVTVFHQACSLISSCPWCSTLLPTKSPSTSSVFPLPNKKSSLSMTWPTPSSMTESSTPPYTMMTLFFPRPSPSSITMSSSTNCLPTLPYHIYLYRLQRPLTPPCPLPALLCLSSWWTEDSTDSWRPSPGTTSPTFSKWFFSPS